MFLCRAWTSERNAFVWSLVGGGETSGDETEGVEGLGGPIGIDCGRDGGRDGGVSTLVKDETQLVSAESPFENLLNT